MSSNSPVADGWMEAEASNDAFCRRQIYLLGNTFWRELHIVSAHDDVDLSVTHAYFLTETVGDRRCISIVVPDISEERPLELRLRLFENGDKEHESYYYVKWDERREEGRIIATLYLSGWSEIDRQANSQPVPVTDKATWNFLEPTFTDRRYGTAGVT